MKVLTIFNESKQKFEANGDLNDNFVHQIHEQKREIFPNGQVSDDIEFNINLDNIHVDNISHCNGMPQQITQLQMIMNLAEHWNH